MSIPVAVLISGRGSNLIALYNACAASGSPAHIALVISNKKGAQGLVFAKKYGIDTKVIDHKNFASRADFEYALDTALVDKGIKIVCLAGFMRILGSGFVNHWRGSLINIHPSLLPSFKGLDTHGRALKSGVKLHGCTVHFVSAEMDEGPIIGQATVPVLQSDNEQSLAERVLAAEHQLYPACLDALARKVIVLEDGKVKNVESPPAHTSVFLNF